MTDNLLKKVHQFSDSIRPVADLNERIAQLAREIYGECDAAEFPVDFIQKKMLSLAASERELGVAAGLEKAAQECDRHAQFCKDEAHKGGNFQHLITRHCEAAYNAERIRSLIPATVLERHDAETRSKLLSDLTHDNDVASALAERDVDIERRARLEGRIEQHEKECHLCQIHLNYGKNEGSNRLEDCYPRRDLERERAALSQTAPAKEDA